MFKNTLEFFEKISKKIIPKIDIENYINFITENQKLEKLEILLNDLLYYASDVYYNLLDNTTEYEIENEMIFMIENLRTKTVLSEIASLLNNPTFETTNKYDKYFVKYYKKTNNKLIDASIWLRLTSINELVIYIVDLIETQKKPEYSNPKHENIFCNNGFILFEYILNEYVKHERGRLSDIHFFYWSMYNNEPQLIHQRPERFKEWFNEKYNEDLGKIKTFNEVNNPDRKIHYSNALNWFKLQNK
jgi:hypothetical protein